MASRDSTNSSVASPSRPRMRYTTRIASDSPFSAHHTLRYTSCAVEGRGVTLACLLPPFPNENQDETTLSLRSKHLFKDLQWDDDCQGVVIFAAQQ